MAEKKINGCMGCLVTLFLLGLIAVMLLGAGGAAIYINREKVSEMIGVDIPSLEEAKSQLNKAVRNAESGKGFSGSAGKLQQADFQQLKEELKRDDMLVLVSYSADWFEPSRQMQPELERLAWKYGDKVVVLNIHIDEEEGLAKSQQVGIIPSFRLFYEGKELARAEGQVPFSLLETMVMQHESVLEGSASRALVLPDGGVIEPGSKKWVPEGFSKTMPTGEPKKKSK